MRVSPKTPTSEGGRATATSANFEAAASAPPGVSRLLEDATSPPTSSSPTTDLSSGRAGRACGRDCASTSSGDQLGRGHEPPPVVVLAAGPPEITSSRCPLRRRTRVWRRPCRGRGPAGPRPRRRPTSSASGSGASSNAGVLAAALPGGRAPPGAPGQTRARSASVCDRFRRAVNNKPPEAHVRHIPARAPAGHYPALAASRRRVVHGRSNAPFVDARLRHGVLYGWQPPHALSPAAAPATPTS